MMSLKPGLANGRQCNPLSARWSPSDRGPDLDLVLFTTERDKYASDPTWLYLFGDLWLVYLETTGSGDPEWFALYDEAGLKLDLLLQQVEPNTPDLENLLAQHPFKGVFSRG